MFIATCGFPSSSMSTLIPVGSSLRVPFLFLIGSSSHHPPQEDEDCECHDGSLHCRFCSNCKYLAVRGFQLDVHFCLEDIWVLNQKLWYPQIIHFNRLWNHYKPSKILGYPYFWRHPYLPYKKVVFCYELVS